LEGYNIKTVRNVVRHNAVLADVLSIREDLYLPLYVLITISTLPLQLGLLWCCHPLLTTGVALVYLPVRYLSGFAAPSGQACSGISRAHAGASGGCLSIRREEWAGGAAFWWCTCLFYGGGRRGRTVVSCRRRLFSGCVARRRSIFTGEDVTLNFFRRLINVATPGQLFCW